jgi:hypothetical protein
MAAYAVGLYNMQDRSWLPDYKKTWSVSNNLNARTPVA